MSKKTLLKQVLFGRIQRYIWLCLFLVAFSFLSTFFNSPQRVEAATSGTMNFQARLMQSSGALVPDGYYNVEFKLWDASTGGTNEWTETYKQANRVRVANGYLTVNLGALNGFSSSINWDQEHWLTMNIGGTANVLSPSWDGEMTPRLKLTAVPYAFAAGKLQQTNGANTSTLGFATQTGSRSLLLPDESGTICLQGSANCGFATGSAANYLQNGSTPQAASFNITGSGTVGGNLTVSGGADFDGVTTFFQSAPTSSPTVFIQGGDGQTSDLLYLSDFDGNNSLSVTKDAMLKIVSNVGSTNILTSRVTMAGASKFEINANGRLSWGDGTLSIDTNLYRGGANLLKTDDTFDAAAFSVGGTAGVSATCSAGQVLQDQVVVGGIVTGGTCVAGGVSSLQGAYDGGNTITTTNARDINFTLADTATDSNFLVNVASDSTSKFAIQNNGTDTFSVGATGNVLSKSTTDSTNAFEVQNADGDSLLNIDTANNVITLGGNNSGELQQWQTTTTLPNPRWFAASTIANGYMYVIGGAQSSGSPRNTVYYAKVNSDGTVGSWGSSVALPDTLQAHTAVATNGYLYVMGGNNGAATDTVYYARLYSDGTTSDWRTTSPFGVGSFWHRAVAANGYIYAMGGYSGSTTYNDVVYAKVNSNGTLGEWESASDLPTTLHSGGAVVANGYLYMIGGHTGATTNRQVYSAKLNSDGSVDPWNSTAGASLLPVGLAHFHSVVMNGYVYVIGGNDGTNSRNEVYYAKLNKDGTVGAWQTAANALPAIRSQYGIASNDGYVYIVGGRETSSTTPVNTVYYTSGQRLMVGGSLDLVGLSDSNIADGGDGGSIGGSLTAGNTNIIGTLQVRGDSSFAQSVNIGGNLNVSGGFMLQPAVDSASAFQVQNAAGDRVFNIDTTNGVVTTFGGAEINGGINVDNGFYLQSNGDPDVDAVRLFDNSGSLYLQHGLGGAIILRDETAGVIAVFDDTGLEIGMGGIKLSNGGTTPDGGITIGDTNLYRSAANTLKTDDSLEIGTNLTVTGSIQGNGTMTLQSTSGTAFQIQNQTGQVLLNADTSLGYNIDNSVKGIGDTRLQNPGFESLAPLNTSGTNGWLRAGSASISTTTVHSGNRALAIPTANVVQDVNTAAYYEVNPGEYMYAEAWARTSSGANGTGGLIATFWNKDYQVVSYGANTGGFSNPGTTWTKYIFDDEVPAGAKYMTIGATVRNTASPTGTWYFDDFYFARETEQSYKLFRNSLDAQYAFQIQNTAGNTLFNADTESMRIGIGTDTPWANLHVVGQGTNGGGARIALGDYCHESETDPSCTSGANVFIGEYGSGDSDQMHVQGREGIVFTTGESAEHINFEIDSTGAAFFQPSTENAYAFLVEGAGGTQYLRVNSLDNQMYLGTSMYNIDLNKGYTIDNGTSSIGNEIPNSSFESDITDITSGRSGYEGSSLVSAIETAVGSRTGQKQLRINSASGSGPGVRIAKDFNVSEGERFYLRGWVKTSPGTNGDGGFYTGCRDINGDSVQWDNAYGTGSTTWQLRSVTITVPAGCVRLTVDVTVRSNSTTGTWYFDDLYLTRSGFEAPTLLKNSSNSPVAFQVQRSNGDNVLTADTDNTRVLIGSAANPTLSSAQLVVTVAEVQATLRVGSATNGISFNDTTTGESGKLRLYGTARNTKKITLTPEFAGAVLNGTGSGSMSGGYDSTAKKNYYRWTSTQTSNQSYEIIIQMAVPSDWSAWASSNPITADTWTSSTANTAMTATVLDTSGNTDSGINAANILPGSNNTWTTSSGATFSGTYTADGVMTLRINMTAKNSANLQLGNITLTYLSKF